VTLPVPSDALSRERINAMAVRMGLEITLAEQFAFLESGATLDLQAAPGSGKTTLVALKLAVLAESWSASTRGICVLSHTNVAADEIAARLSGTPGQRLLRYPHFIGTIQSFVHAFAALPALRSKEVTPQAIDDKAYAAHAERLLRLGQFSALRSFLNNRTNGEKVVTEAKYVFEAGETRLQIPDTPFKRQTKSYAQLQTLKARLTCDGILRYDDMYALAEQYLHRNPRLIAGLRYRFPFVLIDEMQDTDATQADLLKTIFGEVTVVQRVGDVNQHIYLGNGPDQSSSGFPADDALELPVSQRFGSDIARVATRLTVPRPQTIGGNGPDGKLAMITFTGDSIDRVVPKFEELVRGTLPSDVLATSAPRVLGGRINPGDSQLFPKAISCYLPELAPTEPAAADDTLLRTYRKAISATRGDARLRPGAIALWDILRRAVWRHEALVSRDAEPALLPPLTDLDRQIGTPGHRLRALITNALIHDYDDGELWQIFTRRLVDAIGLLIGRDVLHADQLADHLAVYTPVQSATRIERSVVASTIHNAKGETHCATLVLECLTPGGKSHDLGALLPVIAGTQPASKLNKTAQQAALTAFVAATRARHLLALAVHRDRAAPHLEALRQDGWLIIDL